MISIGTIGLIKGISSYDPGKGARLATYAARCIENEILMHFRAQKKLQGEVSLSDTLETDKDGNSLFLLDVVGVEDTMTLAEAVHLAVEEGYSRMPVFHEQLDTILGIFYVKDVLKYVTAEVPPDMKLTDHMRPAYFVPESKNCSELLEEMTARHIQIAIVVDEYGGTEGIVTMEDLLESIVGNIQDEYDDEEQEIFRVSENAFTVDGSTSIDEISDLLQVHLPEGDYDTIAGLVVELLGKIPKPGERPSVTLKSLTFTVEEVEDRRVSKILIVKDVSHEDETKDQEDEEE